MTADWLLSRLLSLISMLTVFVIDHVWVNVPVMSIDLDVFQVSTNESNVTTPSSSKSVYHRSDQITSKLDGNESLRTICLSNTQELVMTIVYVRISHIYQVATAVLRIDMSYGILIHRICVISLVTAIDPEMAHVVTVYHGYADTSKLYG